MKFIFCTCNVSIKDQVILLLEDNGITNYQVADRVIARNVKGSPRFDTAVWPGYNTNITMQLPDEEKAQEIIGLLAEFNRGKAFNDDELLTVCSINMENYFFE